MVECFSEFKLFIVRSSYSHPKINGIVNLSNHDLTASEAEILDLGHSFVSQPAFFDSDHAKRQLHRVVYNKPTIDKIVADVKTTKHLNHLNHSQRNTLKMLRDNKSIVITQADKGDSWVILDKVDYVWECMRQLNDKTVYRPLPNSETSINLKLFRNVLSSMLAKNLISKAKFETLMAKQDRIKSRIFYTLPKIHKPPSDWSVSNKIPSGRPIVGNSYSEDTEICKYIDSFLQPIVAKQPYILTNSDHFLVELESVTVNKNSYLFSLDVASLYTNIPIGQGLETVKYFFDLFPDVNRPDNFIIELLKISLFKNDFFFNGQFFRQKKGVAMGKQYAPNFANLYMSRWEYQILNNFFGSKPLIWLRYIDDIFGIWNGSISGLNKFVEYINNFDVNIQVTCNSSLTDLQFLDLVVYKNDTLSLSTMIYLKPTSSLKLIHPKSLFFLLRPWRFSHIAQGFFSAFQVFLFA